MSTAVLISKLSLIASPAPPPRSSFCSFEILKKAARTRGSMRLMADSLSAARYSLKSSSPCSSWTISPKASFSKRSLAFSKFSLDFSFRPFSCFVYSIVSRWLRSKSSCIRFLRSPMVSSDMLFKRPAMPEKSPPVMPPVPSAEVSCLAINPISTNSSKSCFPCVLKNLSTWSLMLILFS